MARDLSFINRLIVLTGIMFLTHFAQAHDAFFPHHRSDFDSITRRKELRGTVLIITAGFVAVLAGVFYVALRKGEEDNLSVYETEQKRLEHAASEAAQAGHAVYLNDGTSDEAIHAALEAYAQTSRISWHRNAVSVSGEAIRCKIGTDVVVVHISTYADKHQIEVNAFCNEAQARSCAECVARNA